MAYSRESAGVFWSLMRSGRPRSFLVRRMLERMERGEIDETEAAAWLTHEQPTPGLVTRRKIELVAGR